MTTVACAVDPDRLFDRGDRTAALEACLRCPLRRECAREALRANATWGMWAGIWIDGTLEPAARHLRAIAADWPARPRSGRPVAPPAPITPDPAPLPRRRPMTRRSVAVVVAARASGHCEVMVEGCGLSAHRLLSRVARRSTRDATSPAEVYCACRSCADVVATSTSSSTGLLRMCGYLVDSASLAARAPFHWRSARWVLLGAEGQLVEVGERAAARSA